MCGLRGARSFYSTRSAYGPDCTGTRSPPLRFLQRMQLPLLAQVLRRLQRLLLLEGRQHLQVLRRTQNPRLLRRVGPICFLAISIVTVPHTVSVAHIAFTPHAASTASAANAASAARAAFDARRASTAQAASTASAAHADASFPNVVCSCNFYSARCLASAAFPPTARAATTPPTLHTSSTARAAPTAPRPLRRPRPLRPMQRIRSMQRLQHMQPVRYRQYIQLVLDMRRVRPLQQRREHLRGLRSIYSARGAEGAYNAHGFYCKYGIQCICSAWPHRRCGAYSTYGAHGVQTRECKFANATARARQAAPSRARRSHSLLMFLLWGGERRAPRP